MYTLTRYAGNTADRPASQARPDRELHRAHRRDAARPCARGEPAADLALSTKLRCSMTLSSLAKLQ